jgi:hypothetical protein
MRLDVPVRAVDVVDDRRERVHDVVADVQRREPVRRGVRLRLARRPTTEQ